MSPRTSPWPDLVSAGPPHDSDIGPFPYSPFVDAWFETVGSGTALTLGAGDNVLPLVDDDGRLSIAGAANVTDYHSPMGSDPAALAESLAAMRGQFRTAVFDSLPHDSAHLLAGGLSQSGIAHRLVDDEPTMVLSVESEHYLPQLAKKQRHESRRKRRRFVEALGDPQLQITENDDDMFHRFVEMHRQSEGEKGSFITPEMESFFSRLHHQPGWQIAALQGNGRLVATFFGYREPHCFYLYNSAYDESHRDLSPGVVALAELIEALALQGCMRFDFLKGREPYKSRMGAVIRPLYRIECE